MVVKKSIVIELRCPECCNYIKFRILEDGTISGICPYCKSVISIKQISNIEKAINIYHYM